MTHPLDPLGAEEITAAVAAVRATGRLGEGARFASITLAEPAKAAVLAHAPGDPVERRVRLTIAPGPGAGVIEAEVDAAGTVLVLSLIHI